MRIEESLRAHLIADPGVAAAVGSRVYPVTYPQGAVMPVVVYQKTANAAEYAHDGDIGVVTARFQISSFSDNYGEAHNVAWAVRQALAPFGDQPATMQGTDVASIFLEAEFDMFGPTEFEPLSKYHVLSDYVFSIREQ